MIDFASAAAGQGTAINLSLVARRDLLVAFHVQPHIAQVPLALELDIIGQHEGFRRLPGERSEARFSGLRCVPGRCAAQGAGEHYDSQD